MMEEINTEVLKVETYGTLVPENENSTKEEKSEAKNESVSYCVAVLIIQSIPNIANYAASFIMISMNLHYLSKSGMISWIAGAGLGHTWINTVSTCLITCLNLGTVIYSAPAFGARNYYLVGICFHRALILRLLNLIPSIILILLSYYIFKAAGVDEDVAVQAQIYGIYSIPSLLLSGIYNTTKFFLVTNKKYPPLLIIQLIVAFLNWGWCELFIAHLQLGVKGAAFCVGMTNLCGTIMLYIYIIKSKEFTETFFWFRRDSFRGLFQQFKSECYAGAPYYLEWVAYEVYTLVSVTFGGMQAAAWVILYNVISIIYMVPFGVGTVISQQIGNAIGEKKITKAKTFIDAAVCLSIFLVVLNVAVVYLVRNAFVGIYDNSNMELHKITIDLLSIYLLIMPGDIIQSCMMSILKAVGKEKVGTVIFFIAYYAVGFVLGYILGVVKKMDDKGVLIGLGVGCYLLSAMSATQVFITNVNAQAKEIIKTRTR